MPIPRPHTIRCRRGSVYLLSLILLAVFLSLAIAFMAMSDLSLAKGSNYDRATSARMTAESGLSYMLAVLGQLRLPGTTCADDFADNLCQALAARMDFTANLAGEQITVSGSDVCVPDIATDEGSFDCRIRWVGPNRAYMEVRGLSRGASRRIAMELDLLVRQPLVFDYGLASRGQVSISGNSSIVGVNYPEEANVISTTTSQPDAILIEGNTTVSGGLMTSGEDALIIIEGTPSIAGSTDPNVYADSIHMGVETPDFPELDLGPLQALATNVVNSETDIENDSVFSNIRIAPNTNPVFTSKVVINGVIFIEAPNIVKFDGGADVNGFIVTEATNEALSDCQIFFGGHVEAKSVAVLPDTPEFADVKEQTGTFVVAPGFGVTFAGSFSAINGTIAADQLIFTGTAEGVVQGSVIGLADVPTIIGGNVDIYVDRLNANPDPAGFVESFAFSPVPDTYAELD